MNGFQIQIVAIARICTFSFSKTTQPSFLFSILRLCVHSLFCPPFVFTSVVKCFLCLVLPLYVLPLSRYSFVCPSFVQCLLCPVFSLASTFFVLSFLCIYFRCKVLPLSSSSFVCPSFVQFFLCMSFLCLGLLLYVLPLSSASFFQSFLWPVLTLSCPSLSFRFFLCPSLLVLIFFVFLSLSFQQYGRQNYMGSTFHNTPVFLRISFILSLLCSVIQLSYPKIIRLNFVFLTLSSPFFVLIYACLSLVCLNIQDHLVPYNFNTYYVLKSDER